MKERDRDRDQRVRRTRGSILSAFTALVVERPFDELSVADVVAAADVGRSTFYEHFRNKDELLREALAPLLQVLADAAGAVASARVKIVLEHLRENRRLALRLLGGPSAAHVSRTLADLLEARLSGGSGDGRAPMIPIRLAAALVADAQLSVVRNWLEGRRALACPASAAADALCRCSAAIVAALRGAPDGRRVLPGDLG